MEMLGAIVLVFALQKIAALLSIPVILGMIWVKGCLLYTSDAADE